MVPWKSFIFLVSKTQYKKRKENFFELEIQVERKVFESFHESTRMYYARFVYLPYRLFIEF